MAASESRLPKVTAEQRRVAAGQFERANQVILTGDFDYGIQLLLNCCALDPANVIYRQTLRKTAKSKYDNNMRGSALAFLATAPLKLRVKSALRKQDHLRVLELGEQVLIRNPWDVPTQITMAKSFIALGLLDLAIWTLDQARQKDPNHLKINRTLAQLYEKRGAFAHAMALWDWVRKKDPNDVEARNKAKDIAANATIAKGRYEDLLKPSESTEQPAEKAPKTEPQIEIETATHPTESTTETAPEPTDDARPLSDRANREVVPMQERIKADPTNPNGYLQLAHWYRRKEQWERAWEVLDDGLGPTGNDFEMAIEMADLEIEPHRHNLAITEQKLQENPDDAELQEIKRRLVQEIQTRELNIYRQKAERHPTDKTHRFEMGLRLLQLGQIDEAIHELQTARSDPRLHPTCVFYLGFCFKYRKNWRLAERNFEEALQLLPQQEEDLRKETMFELAVGNAKAGQWSKAVDYGYELANLDFTFRDIGRLVDEWQTKMQNA